MNNESIKIKTENTIDDLKSNLKILHSQTSKHEQCVLATQSLIINDWEQTECFRDELAAMLQNQAEDIQSLSSFIMHQVTKIKENNKKN